MKTLTMFRAHNVKDAKPEAVALAKAVVAMMLADDALNVAKSEFRTYTGDRSLEDYVAEEQEEWNRAADSLHNHTVSASLQ